MLYKTLKAFSKICNKRYPNGAFQRHPWFESGNLIATDTYCLVCLASPEIAQICDKLPDYNGAYAVPEHIVKGKSSRDQVDVSEIYMEIEKRPANLVKLLDDFGAAADRVYIDPDLLGKCLSVFKAVGVIPAITFDERKLFIGYSDFKNNFYMNAVVMGVKK